MSGHRSSESGLFCCRVISRCMMKCAFTALCSTLELNTESYHGASRFLWGKHWDSTKSRAYLSGWLQSVTFHNISAVHRAVFVPVQLKY